MARGTEEGAENIMKNVNRELDESATDIEPYLLRKRPRVDYDEEKIIDESGLSDTGIVSNFPVIINDVVGLQLGPLPREESRWLVNDIDISVKWHLFKEKSLELEVSLWKEATGSKARKPIGRAKQPDAIINDVDQLSWSSGRGHGEAKVQEELNNLDLLCTDLIRQLLNRATYHILPHHSSVYVMVEVGHVDVPMSLEQIPAFIANIDTLLIISNAFWENCFVSTEKMELSRRSTLATPSFKEMF
ncbi:1518_t:CDS:2 [Acaulospora colombiana]|uniref:1518_t:CDS:1 n=1 Tax=Acaulospora colombiana TaxID=27376 RepID=A0ACA9M058_9GLOM|nr:1518_t:CDS:2 [Acaulospora colombiana]